MRARAMPVQRADRDGMAGDSFPPHQRGRREGWIRFAVVPQGGDHDAARLGHVSHPPEGGLGEPYGHEKAEIRNMGARRRIGAEISPERAVITPAQARGRGQDRPHVPSKDVGAGRCRCGLRDGDDVGVVGDPVRPHTVAPGGGGSGYHRLMVEVGRRRMRGEDPRLRHALQIVVADGFAVVDGDPPADDGDGDAPSARAAGGARRVSRAGADQPQAALEVVFDGLPGAGRPGGGRRLQRFGPVDGRRLPKGMAHRRGVDRLRRVRAHRSHRRRARRR